MLEQGALGPSSKILANVDPSDNQSLSRALEDACRCCCVCVSIMRGSKALGMNFCIHTSFDLSMEAIYHILAYRQASGKDAAVAQLLKSLTTRAMSEAKYFSTGEVICI